MRERVIPYPSLGILEVRAGVPQMTGAAGVSEVKMKVKVGLR